MSKDSGTLVLRNYPDDDALKHPEKYPKALSFSPDIIPLYGAKVEKDALLHPSSWRGYAGMPIVGGDVNHVYIRGHGSGGPHVASLRTFPSELIMWPQVWSKVNPVSSGPVVIPGGDTLGPYASEDPLWFRPPHTIGNAYSLVANVFKHDPANVHKNLHEYEPMPSFNAKQFDADDLLSFLHGHNNFTFHNVVVADPTLKHVSVHTRLRMFGKSNVSVRFRLDGHEGARVPPGLEVSLLDDHGKIAIPRTPLSSFEKHQPIQLDPLYDGILTLHVHSPENNSLFEPYSGLSLKVLKVGKSGPGLLLAAADSKATPDNLMGALNVVFEPHATRNLRFASPSAMQLREFKNCPRDDGCRCPREENCAAIPTTTPAATGWWFRTQMNDINHYPHAEAFGISPDIQPIGTDTDLTTPGLWKALQDPNVDYAKEKSIELVGDANNYIFIRGHSTIPDIDVQTRVFAALGNLLIHPSQYTTGGVQGHVLGGDELAEQQSISVAVPNEFYLINRPLNIKAPPNPNPGNTPGPSWGARPHYCLIAEARQKRKCSLVYPNWPSEQVEDFRTMQDFQSWFARTPLVCGRNINWEPYKPNPGEKCWTWACGTQLSIPDSSFRSTFWTIIVECDNPIIPPGSQWSLMCDDNEIFPNGLCFKDLPIGDQSPGISGCHFTGATPGRTPNLTLMVSWCDGGLTIPPPSIKIKLAVTEITKLSPVIHLAQDPHTESHHWPFYVGKGYPYIGLGPHPAPLPTFASAGPNTWPLAGSPHFVVGQVTLAAKIE